MTDPLIPGMDSITATPACCVKCTMYMKCYSDAAWLMFCGLSTVTETDCGWCCQVFFIQNIRGFWWVNTNLDRTIWVNSRCRCSPSNYVLKQLWWKCTSWFNMMQKTMLGAICIVVYWVTSCFILAGEKCRGRFCYWKWQVYNLLFADSPVYLGPVIR